MTKTLEKNIKALSLQERISFIKAYLHQSALNDLLQVPQVFDITQAFQNKKDFSAFLKEIIYWSFEEDNKNEELREKAVLEILQMIPEVVLSLQDKCDLIKKLELTQNKEKERYFIKFVHYREPLKPLFKLKDKKYSTEKIQSMLGAACSQNIDKYESFLIFYSCFKSLDLKNTCHQAFQFVRQAFLEDNGNQCRAYLEEIADQLLAQKILSRVRYEVITNALRSTHVISHNANDPRRFLENKLAQFYLGCDLNLLNINTILQEIMQISASTIEEAARALIFLSEIDRPTAKDRMLLYQRQSSFYARRGIYYRNNKEARYSKNKGIMRASAPNFYDEISQEEMSNRVVDTRIPSGEAGTYSLRSVRSPFVGSLSGHAMSFAALLVEYARAHSDSTTLQEDINQCIKGYIAASISWGYHSYKEMRDAILEETIQKDFKQLNLKLDLNFSDKVADIAFREAAEYAFSLHQRKIMRAEIQNRNSSSDLDEDTNPKP